MNRSSAPSIQSSPEAIEADRSPDIHRSTSLRTVLFAGIVATFVWAAPIDAQGIAGPFQLADMYVHSSGNNTGYVLDKFGSSIQGTQANPISLPLVWALEHTGSVGGTTPTNQPTFGRYIAVFSGKYSRMRMKVQDNSNFAVNWLGGTTSNPVIVEGTGNVTIERRTSVGYGDTLEIISGANANHPFNHITWRNIRFEGSDRSAMIFGGKSDALNGISFKSWRFENCEIDGGWDHGTQSGNETQWGIHAYALSDFAYIGGSAHNTEAEHAFYLHNNFGDVVFDGVDIYEVGRTAIQIVARPSEGPQNPNEITIKNCTIADTGLQTTRNGSVFPSNFHNGQSITIVGGNTGRINILNNQVYIGLDTFTPGLRASILAQPTYPAGVPYGNGAFVSWTNSGANYANSGFLKMTGNHIEYEDNSGAYTPVLVTALNVAVVRNNTIFSGLRSDAIRLGNTTTPSPFHPVPLKYCVRDNLLIPGNTPVTNLYVGGILDPNGIASFDLLCKAFSQVPGL